MDFCLSRRFLVGDASVAGKDNPQGVLPFLATTSVILVSSARLFIMLRLRYSYVVIVIESLAGIVCEGSCIPMTWLWMQILALDN